MSKTRHEIRVLSSSNQTQKPGKKKKKIEKGVGGGGGGGGTEHPKNRETKGPGKGESQEAKGHTKVSMLTQRYPHRKTAGYVASKKQSSRKRS